MRPKAAIERALIMGKARKEKHDKYRRKLTVDIMRDLNRRIAALETDSEGGGYESSRLCEQQIDELEAMDK